METILGIDLGTTNSVVSVIQDGKPIVLRDGAGSYILPSVVGFDQAGRLLVGQEARNQALLAPERTVKSIKRQMGDETKTTLGDQQYSPQEISAMILRTLKERAERSLGQPLSKAVITVPAFFKDKQRQATREAGELAGLEVIRIINEPTAASLTYEPHTEKNERLLVYDLGGGTFDVSIVQIERGVVEVLSSHGDTHLGGDDFDELLFEYVREQFQDEYGVDLSESPVARSRLLQAVEEAKKRLSEEAFTTIAEEFIATKDATSLNLNMEIKRLDYEDLIRPLLDKTIACVDAALEDAKLTAKQIDRVILVGGSSRTPLVRQILMDQLQHEPHLEIDPDLCVAMGAAVQGALIAGVDVGPVLVDITPHTLGIRCVGDLHGRYTNRLFSPVIPRNTPLPATRSEIYYTGADGQEVAQIEVYQGEHDDATFNEQVGELLLEGLADDAEAGSEILVRFRLDLDGILTVAAAERDTGLEKQVTLENAITRFRASSREEAKAKLAAMFSDSNAEAFGSESLLSAASPDAVGDDDGAEASLVAELLAKARRLLANAPSEDADEMRELITALQEATASGNTDRAVSIADQLSDLVFYLEDA
ncbi:MAG: Hsp70 family protein [Planctomycetota bacterium]|nr:Hsp70 family protein [Planctomycetota bacterium]